MKRAKLLSLFLAGSLLFQTAGIDAMATAPSEPVPISETVEEINSDLSGQPSEENNGSNESADESDSEQTPEGEEGKEPAGEEENSGQPSEEEENKESAGGEESTEQPSEDEEKDMAGGEENPEQPAEDEEKDMVGGEENSKQPSEGEEDQEPAEEGEREDSVSENTVSENSISENSIPEDEISVFSIFPGLGENYKFSSQQMADKQVLSSHVGDVVQIQSMENATIEDFQDAEGEYEPGEVVYLAETRGEAEQVAAAFGGTLNSYVSEVAVISLPKKATVALAIAAAAEPEIKLPAVWPNYYNYLYTDTNASVNPDLPYGYESQWHHEYIGTRYAWAAGYKGQGIKVAIIDTGLTRNHEDLEKNAVNGKTYVNDAPGTEHNTDNNSHGTHVAGIIAADDNDKGVVGIAPDAQVRGYSVFSAEGICKTSWILSAIKDAVKDGNDIINMSLGSPNYSQPYENVVNEAYDAGVAIIAASGNDDTNGNNFPAAFANTISIGAVDENGARASFSCYGSTVTLAFPGVDIYSTLPTGYGNASGTSMACPAAVGTAAVILSAREDIRAKTGKARVSALLSAMKSSTNKCVDAGMGVGTTYLPGVLKISTEMTAPDAPVIDVVNEASYQRGANKKDYIAESVNVTISSATAVSVDIYYSTNGKAPVYKDGVITNADNEEPYQIGTPIVLSGAKSKTISAIAVNPVSGMVSKAASKTVTLTPVPSGVTVTPVDNVKKVVAGKSLKFTAAVTPSYAISNKVAWSVDDKAKAAGITVSNGTVKTKNTTEKGNYTVIATAVGSDGKSFNGKSDTFEFSVIASSPVAKVAFIDPATKKAPKGKSIKTTDSKTADTDNKVINLADYLVVTTTDANKTKTDITGKPALDEVVWSSSNTKVARVSNDEEDRGTITAVAPGKATIKAVSNDGGKKSASYSVTVVQPVEKITITGSSKVAAGKGIALTAKVFPANASNKKVEWSVEGNDKVKIGKTNGKLSVAKDASGTCTVKAIAADKLGVADVGTYSVSIVNEEITKITLNEKKLTLFPPRTSATQNTTTTLTATVTGKKGGSAQTLSDPLITWTSSAPSVATVDSDGKITARASGKATITCAATDGSNKKATCAVTVTVPMSRLVVGPADGNSGLIAVGKKIRMTAKYYSNYGKPASNKIDWEIVAWDKVDKEKVSIDKNGTVSVAQDVTPGGTVTVRATAKDGSGVTSNEYQLLISPSFAGVRLKEIVTVDANNRINGYHFIVEATAAKDSSGKPDWNDKNKIKMLPGYYCTATLSGPKNVGLYKDYLDKEITGLPYDVPLYDPQPLKGTSKNLDYLEPFGNVKLYTNECDKISLTVTLKDGSNLKTTVNKYAIHYINSAGYAVIGYYD